MSDNNNSSPLTRLDKTPGLEKPDSLTNFKRSESGDIEKNKYDEFLDFALEENGGPGYSSALSSLLKGTRILGPGNEQAPIPDDVIGLPFVSRPLLNLSDTNIERHDLLRNLVRPRPNSIQGYVKGMLDRRWGAGNPNELLDNETAWITPLTNLCKVSEGFPDMSLNIKKSSPGIRNQVYTNVDGILTFNGDLNLRQSYFTAKPNILPLLFETWVHYIEGVKLGDELMSPYPEALQQNYIDYDTRIYHLILNKNLRSIEGIYCNAAGAPNTLPVGAQSGIDRTQSTARGQGQDEYQMNFEGVGFRFNSLLVCSMFNKTTYYFNPNMRPEVRATYYRKLRVDEYFAYQYGKKGGVYPVINIESMELEYWGPKDVN